jgi:hypothetical protein
MSKIDDTVKTIVDLQRQLAALTAEEKMLAGELAASVFRREGTLVLQPGFTSASGALAPVAFASALLMPPSPDGPVLDRLNRRRSLPHQMPEQPPHLRHGEREQLHGDAPDGGLSPRWRAGARWSDRHAPASIR